MTEKRFEYCIDEVGMYYYICDNTKKGDDRIILELYTKFDAIEVCDWLNKLNDENEQLKQQVAFLEEFIKIGVQYEYYQKIYDDNEQLKQKNNKAIELILDGVVEMHDGKRDYAETILNKAIKLLKGDVE